MLFMNISKGNSIRVFLFIIGISLVPILFTFGKLAIGGDTMIPLNSTSLEKYLLQWIGTQNGQYFSINYYPLYLFYAIFEWIHLDIYLISSFILFLLNIIAGYGIYFLVRLFSDAEDSYIVTVPVLFYLFSPALLNGWHYLYIYSLAPWLIYFVFKCIKRSSIEFSDIVWINIILFFYALDLPNPKYLFHFFITVSIIFVFGFLLKLIKLEFFRKNIWKLIILFVSLAYLIIPLAYFSLHYSPETYGIHVKSGYKDKGNMMDAGSATIDKMFRLHHDGLNLNQDERLDYQENNLVSLLSYLFILLILISFSLPKKSNEEEKYKTIFLIEIAAFLFLAAGPNPPFGALYEALVERFSFLAFLRTTAGAVFFLSIFYALALCTFLRAIPLKYKKLATIIVLSVTVMVSYPLWNGDFYQNNTATNQYVVKGERGIRIPTEYFRMQEILDKKRLDAKVLVPNIDSSYISTSWGYFGPPLYYFIFKSGIITLDKVYSDIYAHNVGLILSDFSTIKDQREAYKMSAEGFKEVAKENFLTLSSVMGSEFLQHFYIPKRVISSRKNIEQLSNIYSDNSDVASLAVFFQVQMNGNEQMINSLTSEINTNTTLEFKKINLTKYRLRVHRGTGIFPIVFSENFHEQWKLYLMNTDDAIQKRPLSVSEYVIFDGNDEEQATKEELLSYIDRGVVTNKRGGGKEDIVEFISKDFQGTVQNDNLPQGNFWETWFKSPLYDNTTHAVVNGYANSWVIDTEKMCRENPITCYRNPDGTYEFEFVVEFWPQRLFLMSATVSGMGFFGSILLFVVRPRRKKRD